MNAEAKVDWRRRLSGDLAVEFGFEVVDGGGAGFDFGDDLVLFGEGWKRQSDFV